MEIRRPEKNDVEKIEEIAAKYNGKNPLPKTFETAAIAEQDSTIIAFGVLRSNLEVLLYTIGSDREKVTAISALFETAIRDARKLGYTKIYMFSDTESFARICEKHFKFRRINAIPLILELE